MTANPETANPDIQLDCCPLCERGGLRDLGELGARQLAACRHCDHRFVARVAGAALTAEYRAAYYRDADDPRIAAWADRHAAIWDTVLAQILARHPTASSLLDVGAGSGGFLARVRAHHPRLQLAAIEPSPAARTALQRRFPDLDLLTESAERIRADRASFDVVTMLQTLEHVRDPRAVLAEIQRVLGADGLLFVTVPNRRSLDVLRRGRHAGVYADGTHLHFFRDGILRRLLRETGFDRIERVVACGGGQVEGRLLVWLQFLLRASGSSAELRYVARRP